MTSINNLEYILSNPGQFIDEPGDADQAALTSYRSELETDLDSVAKAASHALNHPKDASMPTLKAVFAALPKRREGESNALAGQGSSLVNADALARDLRDTLPEGKARDGFNVEMAVETSNTAWGPGQQSIKSSLDGAGQVGFQLAVDYCQSRNRNTEVAAKGAAVLLADADADAARRDLPGQQWIGFEIASGVFGNPKLGALGNTLMGPGSEKIHDSLTADGQLGFDAAVRYHMSRKYV